MLVEVGNQEIILVRLHIHDLVQSCVCIAASESEVKRSIHIDNALSV